MTPPPSWLLWLIVIIVVGPFVLSVVWALVKASTKPVLWFINKVTP